MVSRSSRSPGSTVFRVVVNKLAVLLNKLAILKYVDVFQIRRWRYRISKVEWSIRTECGH